MWTCWSVCLLYVQTGRCGHVDQYAYCINVQTGRCGHVDKYACCINVQTGRCGHVDQYAYCMYRLEDVDMLISMLIVMESPVQGRMSSGHDQTLLWFFW